MKTKFDYRVREVLTCDVSEDGFAELEAEFQEKLRNNE